MAEKTHTPTAKRIQDARRRGDISTSRELTGTAAYAGLIICLATWAPSACARITRLFDHVMAATTGSFTLHALLAELNNAACDALLLAAVPALSTAVAAALGGFAQARGLMAMERVKPDFSHLDPAKGLKRYFSSKVLVDFGKNMLKLAALCALLYWLIRHLMAPMARLTLTAPGDIAYSVKFVFGCLFGMAGCLFAIFAAIDVLHQRHEHEKRLRMSKEELRREHKDSQGDPQIRSARRQLARSLLQAPGVQSGEAPVR